MKPVNERSRLQITMQFQDAAWALQVPTNIRYRIDDLTNCQVIQDWIDVTPASSVTVIVTPTQNAIIASCNRTERKELTVEANYGLDTQFTDTFDWQVRNIKGIS